MNSSTPGDSNAASLAFSSPAEPATISQGWESNKASLFARSGDLIEVSVSFIVRAGSNDLLTSWSIGSSGPLSSVAAGPGAITPLGNAGWYSGSSVALYSVTQDGQVQFWVQANGVTGSPAIFDLFVVAAVVSNAAGEAIPVVGGAKGIASATNGGRTSVTTGWTSSGATLNVDVGDIIQVFATCYVNNASLSWSITSTNATPLFTSTNLASPASGGGLWYNQERTALFVSTAQGPVTFALQVSDANALEGTGVIYEPVIVALAVTQARSGS